LAMVERRYELDFRGYWWFYTLCIRIIPTFQRTHFYRIYAANGGVFIIMAIAWGWIFERIVPDVFDIVGAIIAIVGVIVIFYMPRNGVGERSLWSTQQ
jgi:small multidrug resistance family-3 protein